MKTIKDTPSDIAKGGAFLVKKLLFRFEDELGMGMIEQCNQFIDDAEKLEFSEKSS